MCVYIVTHTHTNDFAALKKTVVSFGGACAFKSMHFGCVMMTTHGLIMMEGSMPGMQGLGRYGR